MVFRIFRRSHISIQLLLMFLAIEFPAELALVYVSYYNAQAILKDELNEKLNSIAERQTRQINNYFDTQIENITVLSQLPDLVSIVEEVTKQVQEEAVMSASDAVKTSLYRYQDLFKLSSLIICSPEKKIIFSNNLNFKITDNIINENANFDIVNLIDRVSTLLQTEYSDFTFVGNHKSPSVFIGSPIRSKEGRFLGILLAEISNEAISNTLNDYIGLGKTGETLLISQVENKSVAITDARFYKLSKEELKINQTNPLPLGEILQGKSGSGFFKDYRDKEVFASYAYLPSLRSALIVKIDTAEAFLTILNFRWILIIIVLATLVVVVLAAFSAANFFTSPIRTLTASALRFSSGKLDERIELPHKNEIGTLKDAFNQMAENLQKAQKDLENYNQTLEKKVAERTFELEKKSQEIEQKNVEIAQANQSLKENFEELQSTQSHLVESEKMAMLGQLIAGVAHEINTPLGAIRSSVGNIVHNLESILGELPAFFRTLSSTESEKFFEMMEASSHKDITISAREERKYRRALQAVLEEKGIENAIQMAERLVEMGIYEDISPYEVLCVSPSCEVIVKKAHTLSGVLRSANTIQIASDKAAKIVFALKNYARHNYNGEMEKFSLSEGLETVLTIYHNTLKHGVEVIKEYDFHTPIYGLPDELNQVWTNLIHNALQAMDYKGTLEINLFSKDEHAVISIKDSGKGIPIDIQDKIFKPFFTTKPIGEGSGLGLDIVKKIIEKHQGNIYFESELGEGTTFFVELPIKIE